MSLTVAPPPSRRDISAIPPKQIEEEDGGRGAQRRTLYICASTKGRIEQIQDFVIECIPEVREKVTILTYTDPLEFEQHARENLTRGVKFFVGLCLRLDETNIDAYFGVLCRLALGMIPKSYQNPDDGEDSLNDIRVMLCRFLTFGRPGDEHLAMQTPNSSWDDFLDVRNHNTEFFTAIREIFAYRFNFDTTYTDASNRLRATLCIPRGDPE